jgi:mono/diheme cytochrome c family protein
VVTPVLAGGEMFRAYCASCHGVDAKGNGPAASALKSLPTDLTQLSKRNAGKFPRGEVEDAIRGNTIIPAHGSREMPVWGQAFRSVNPDEAMIRIKVHNLALYIESLQAK